MTGAREAIDRLVEVLIGLLGMTQVDEHAIVAVGLRRAEWLVGDRQDPPAVLAGRFGHELLDPQPEALNRRRDDEGQLVAPAPGELADGRAEP